MGEICIHPRLQVGQTTIEARLRDAVARLRDDGLASLARASAALRALPATAQNGETGDMLTELTAAIRDLRSISRDEFPPLSAVYELEARLSALGERLARFRPS